MLIDTAAGIASTPAQVEKAAVAAENAGYAGFGVPETRHDVFTVLALAARATERITLQSAIAVAFARNPMTVAIAANDIQLISGGRFQLGLGSQVQQHIERRFHMPWSQPAARMEDFLGAVRAIWTAWQTGDRLFYKGPFYQHTLMTDFFNPGPNPHGQPQLVLAAVGERMTAVAGRLADGLICHGFTTERYLRERTLPIAREARGGSLEGFSLRMPSFVVLGRDEAERAKAEAGVRGQIAFYGSTPAYRPVLELHGWGDLYERLNNLSKRQAWAEMGDEISDEVLSAFAVAGTPAEVASGLKSRFGDVVDRISMYAPYRVDPAQVAEVTALLAG